MLINSHAVSAPFVSQHPKQEVSQAKQTQQKALLLYRAVAH